MACLTRLRLTPWVSCSHRSDGTRAPGASWPVRIWSRSSAASSVELMGGPGRITKWSVRRHLLGLVTDHVSTS